MFVGIASGTYSSIFIASPVLTAWKEREPGFVRRRLRIAETEGGKVPAYADEDRDGPAASRRRDRAAAAARSEDAASRGRTPERSPRPSGPRRAATVPVRAITATTEAAEAASSERRPAQRRAPRPPPSPPQARKEPLKAHGTARFLHDGDRPLAFHLFVPDRFWQGIVGAFIGAVLGSIIFGLIVQSASGKNLADTDLSTALIAIPGNRDRPGDRLRDRRPLRSRVRLTRGPIFPHLRVLLAPVFRRDAS